MHRQDIYLKDKFSQSSPGNDSVQNNSVLRDQYFKHFKGKEFMSCHHRIFFTYNTIGPSKDALRRGILLRNHSGRLKAVDVPPKKKIDEFCKATADFMSAAFQANRNGEMYKELRREDYTGEGSAAGIIESYLSLSSGESDSPLSFVSDLYSEDGDSISID